MAASVPGWFGIPVKVALVLGRGDAYHVGLKSDDVSINKCAHCGHGLGMGRVQGCTEQKQVEVVGQVTRRAVVVLLWAGERRERG